MTKPAGAQLAQTDAAKLLVRWLRELNYGSFTRYGYSVYLPSLVRIYLQNRGVAPFDVEQKMTDMMPMLYAAAWDLCRRGILRPGVETFNAQPLLTERQAMGIQLRRLEKRGWRKPDAMILSRRSRSASVKCLRVIGSVTGLHSKNEDRRPSVAMVHTRMPVARCVEPRPKAFC
jgi:hypothetical protein